MVRSVWLNNWEQTIKNINKYYIYYAKVNDDIAGFIKGPNHLINNSIGEIGSIYLLPKYKGLKIGNELLYEAFKYLHDKGANKIFTYCYWMNHSQYFFNKHGAKSIGMNLIMDPYLHNNHIYHHPILSEVMYWDPENMKKYLNGNTFKKDYTRKTIWRQVFV